MHPNKPHILLGYWKSRGRAQVARQMLSICGQQWEEKHYTDDKQWFEKDKKQLGIPFPNLPYLIDGDLKLTESVAIYRHILRKFGKRQYLGRSVNDEAVVDQILSLTYDIDHQLLHLFWDPEWKAKIERIKKTTIPKLRKLNQFYGQRTYALDYPTLPDFVLAELSYYFQRIIPEQYKEMPFLPRLRTQVSNMLDIKAYYEKKGSHSFVQQGDLKF